MAPHPDHSRGTFSCLPCTCLPCATVRRKEVPLHGALPRQVAEPSGPLVLPPIPSARHDAHAAENDASDFLQPKLTVDAVTQETQAITPGATLLDEPSRKTIQGQNVSFHVKEAQVEHYEDFEVALENRPETSTLVGLSLDISSGSHLAVDDSVEYPTKSLPSWIGESQAPEKAFRNCDSAQGKDSDAEIEVKLLSLAGEVLIGLHLPPSTSILHLRRRVWKQCGIIPFAMQIVHPTQGVLSDDSLLQEFVAFPNSSLSLSLVRQHFKPELDTALLKHVAHNDVQAVWNALRTLADPNCESVGTTPLVYASQVGLTDVVCALCDAGAEVDRASGCPAKTPLLSALQNRHTDVVRSLCDSRARLNVTDRSMMNPLCLAAQLGSADVVRLLCEARADINEASQDHSTPLLIAAQRGHSEIVHWLCNQSADLEKSRDDGATPLLIAASLGHLDIVRCICKAGANKNIPWRSGVTPLLNAAAEGHAQVVRTLCEAGADVNRARRDGATPLLVAAERGFVDIVHLLCQHGADKEKVRKDGATPLHAASKNGRDQVVAFLCSTGGSLDQVANLGDTPLLAAIQSNHLAVARCLCNAKADVNTAGLHGVTALIAACRSGNIAVVELLCKARADLSNAEHDGTTPMLAASQRGHFSVVKYLTEAGAEWNNEERGGQSPLTRKANLLGTMSTFAAVEDRTWSCTCFSSAMSSNDSPGRCFFNRGPSVSSPSAKKTWTSIHL